MKSSFTAKDFELFKSIAKLPESSLYRGLTSVLKEYYETENVIVGPENQYVMAKGDIPVMLVAHLDTVFKIPPYNFFWDRDKNVIFADGTGLGADDRAGVFGILYILNHTKMRPSVLFTRGEETGGRGAKLAAKTLSPSVKYLVELDRQGHRECVFYDCGNREFERYVNSFGFHTEWGSFSDISILCPEWKVAGVNLSIGYYHEHTYGEILFADEMMDTVKRVITMLKSIEKAPTYEYVHEERIPYAYLGVGNRVVKCSGCNKEFPDADTVDVITSGGRTRPYCWDCLSSYVDFCDICEEPVEKELVEGQSVKVCPECKKSREAIGIWN